MSFQVTAIAVISAIYFLIRLLNRTDVPKIKGLAEIPGYPIFGSLIELGNNHAKVAREWSKKYGPVFQVRMGNRVRGNLNGCNAIARLTFSQNRGSSSQTPSIP